MKNTNKLSNIIFKKKNNYFSNMTNCHVNKEFDVAKALSL